MLLKTARRQIHFGFYEGCTVLHSCFCCSAFQQGWNCPFSSPLPLICCAPSRSANHLYKLQTARSLVLYSLQSTRERKAVQSPPQTALYSSFKKKNLKFALSIKVHSCHHFGHLRRYIERGKLKFAINSSVLVLEINAFLFLKRNLTRIR